MKPLKRGLSKKLRELLQPQRTLIEEGGASKEYYMKACQKSLKRCQSPIIDEEDKSPFQVLLYAKNVVAEKRPSGAFHETDFSQVDSYASTVQQRGPLMTPSILSQKFLARPYRRDLYRLRAIFIWLIQNIRPEYDQRRRGEERHLVLKQRQPPLGMTAHQKTRGVYRMITHPPIKENLFVSPSDLNTLTEEPPSRLDTMDSLEQEALLTSSISFEENRIKETAKEVLEKRSCKTALGMANLFIEMVKAAGFEDAYIIYGYLKAPKDSVTSENKKLNHVWCLVKIEGEYRMIDCWLASPFHPQNENKMESHWFLTRPIDMIMTHLPMHQKDQYLNPPLSTSEFFELPYVRHPFFWYQMQVIESCTDLRDKGNGVFYVSLKLAQLTIQCYAEVEADDGTIVRGLAQCYMTEKNDRFCKIKAVLPPHQSSGWLKVYAGPRNQINPSHQETIHQHSLALCIRIHGRLTSSDMFELVQLHTDPNEFYIQEPQCYYLYPLQTYHFCIRANESRVDNHHQYHRITHHKLAIKSPGGKLVKLMYYPQDQVYNGTVTISEAGEWSLICLQHHTGGSYTIATWACKIMKKNIGYNVNIE
ncbi:uncharacterized protein BX663DRAFT_518198 [Cokeromyces recurvatus]|uniref:uncharacterized protein n=1 Tax=Cokeromyces recurvatus TaxID=90255 RepID=UPI00221F3B84|nr:uncharacterized protein BX663DRAFT_518198 [Cokeromyces recurvatus]KAI7900297.1 hypothetical protein BX663DRAFT_518198 [Cokeromyces recurvatus]